MLKELYIQNLAVIEKTTITLENGLNVFTGETGAGKSIVIDAINAVLGQRTSKEIVRHGETKAIITAGFCDVSKAVLSKLAEYGYELQSEDDELIITREIFADSKSTARLMGRPINISILKEIGAELITIHGQHDNQVLLSPEKHIEILDRYGDFSALQEEYLTCYHSVVAIKREMKKTAATEQDKAERIDSLTYQLDEIEQAELKEGEEEALSSKRLEIRNAEKILEQLYTAYNAIYGDEGESGALGLAKTAVSSLERASELYEDGENLYSSAVIIYDEMSELSDRLRESLDGFDFDKGKLEAVEDRLELIRSLKRKYGATEAEVFEYAKNAREELDNLSLSEKRLVELNQRGQEEYERLLKLGAELSAARAEAADRFVKSVSGELVFLDMPSVRLEVSITRLKPGSRGMDEIEFLISTNKGEPPKPIAKIASGGELSRIMLAIKNTLADKDEIQTLIFDEIDTGVSGRAAQKIGLKLKQAAKNRQILSVTHLAQIAALADHHYLIQKRSDNVKTFTSVQKLDMAGRIEETARIMSTDSITELMRQNATAMIENGFTQ